MKTTAVILAAGQGTRMKSKLPKVLHQALGKPMVQWVLDCLSQAGVQDKIAVLGHGGEQVALEFTIRDNRFTEIAYRTLQYRGEDYLAQDAGEPVRSIAGQFQALIAYLVGKDIAGVNDLYRPGEIVPDVDGFSGATIRAPKVISAIWDGLGRHAYRLD